MSDRIAQFEKERQERLAANRNNKALVESADAFNSASNKAMYSYNFSWMGRPIIQYPQDIIAMQEIIWQTKPDLIIETGIAHGGSIIYYASLLELIGKGMVLGIDIDIRAHNREAIESHPMMKRITMFEGSSVDDEMLEKVKAVAKDKQTILVVLDSNHTHDHVLAEMRMYGSLVTKGSYMVVFDTIVENLPDYYLPNRPWKKGDNPMTAVEQFLKENKDFQVDADIDNKLLISVSPKGYLKRI